jgi:HK97 family phage major capsid protein
MKVTSSLKSLLQSKGVKPDATEQEVRKAAYAELAKGDEAFEKSYLDTQKDDPNVQGGSALVATLEKLAKDVAELKSNPSGNVLDDHRRGLSANAPAMPDLGKALVEGSGESTDHRQKVDVIGAHKQYDGTKKRLHFPERTRKGEGVAHPFAGQPAFEGEGHRPLYEPSELDRAVMGAFIKFSVTQADKRREGVPRKFWMTEHDWGLMQYALHECEWGGTANAGSDGFGQNGDAIGIGGQSGGQKLSPRLQKAILDDATSGGLEAAPILFDDQLIQIPLLHSEFFPKVKVVNITRGRRIEGASIGTVTITSSTEGTAISLFNTANFIAAFDTTIFVASGAIEIGLDFLSDSPLDIAGAVAADYQQVMLQWLDSQIIGGDGTTEPEGILSASGTTTVNATNGSGGPWTVGDVEALLFGVSKAYKGGTDPNRIGFGSLEATYRRIRAIAVSTTDQRRVFGMTHEDYKVLMRFWGIGSSSTGGFTSNRQAIFANFARYRMYRRLGLQVTREEAGSTLRRANTMLLIARSRWGGQLEDGAAAAVCADGQS